MRTIPNHPDSDVLRRAERASSEPCDSGTAQCSRNPDVLSCSDRRRQSNSAKHLPMRSEPHGKEYASLFNQEMPDVQMAIKLNEIGRCHHCKLFAWLLNNSTRYTCPECTISLMDDTKGRITQASFATGMRKSRTVLRMVFYVCDVASDWYLVVTYLMHGDFAWSGLTTLFIVVPQFTIAFRSLIPFKSSLPFFASLGDRERNALPVVDVPFRALLKQTPLWVIIVHSLQMGPIIRYWAYLLYSGNGTFLYVARTSTAADERYNFLFWKHCKTVANRLCFVESFMEALPQMTLQTFILIKQQLHHHLFVASHAAQILSILFSVVSVAYGFSLLQLRLWKTQQTETKCQRFTDRTVHRTGHLITLVSRIIILVIFASQFGAYIFALYAAHVALITAALYYRFIPRWSYYEHMLVPLRLHSTLHVSWTYPWEASLIKVIMWVFYPWTTFFDWFVDIRERRPESARNWKYARRTVKLFCFGYGLLLVENIVMLVLWIDYADTDYALKGLLLLALIVSYILGIGLVGMCMHRRKLFSSDKLGTAGNYSPVQAKLANRSDKKQLSVSDSN